MPTEVPPPVLIDWQPDTSYESVEAFEKDWPEAIPYGTVGYSSYDDGEEWYFYKVGDTILQLWVGSGIEFTSNGFELSETTEEEMWQIIANCERN